MFSDLKNCQCEVHNWGKANQVSFDASKESMYILALKNGEGPNFRLLGVPFDNELRMNDAIAEIVGSATWKMGAILRTARYFNDAELIHLYKSKLLSFLEYRTAAIYHACNTTLLPWIISRSIFFQNSASRRRPQCLYSTWRRWHAGDILQCWE